MGHPSEVDEIFDAISYSKGASIIRMLHSYIGDAVSLHWVYCILSSTRTVDILTSLAKGADCYWSCQTWAVCECN